MTGKDQRYQSIKDTMLNLYTRRTRNNILFFFRNVLI